MKKVQAAIPDSDLDLHVSGCYCLYEGVPCNIPSARGGSVNIVNHEEGINDRVPIEDVEFYWPEMGYVNTQTGCVYCTRRVADGRSYRRAFGHRSFNIYNVHGCGVASFDAMDGIRSIVYQLYVPTYPTYKQAVALLRGRLRPAVAVSKQVALALNGDTIAVHIGGVVVGSLDYSGDALTVRDRVKARGLVDFVTGLFVEAYNGTTA